MKKTLLVLLLAGLLLVSFTACGGEGNGNETDSASNETASGDPLGSESDDDTSDTGDDSESESDSTVTDIDQTEADFTDKSMEICVYKQLATVRKAPSVNTDTYVTTASRGDVFTVTGESTYWYRVSVIDAETEEPATYYLAKTVAGDKAVLDAFVDGDPTSVTTTGDVFLRLFPSAEDDSTKTASRVSLPKGTTVTRVSESNGWSKVLYKNTVDGDEAEEYYYINSTFLTENTEAQSEA